MTTLANSWAGSFGFSYDAMSRRTQMTRPNGIATNYSYDKLSNLLSVLHQAGPSTIDGEAYTVDPAGNRTAKTDDLAGVTSNYTYDKIYELTQVIQGVNTTEAYSYDPVGNRLSSLGVSSYTNNTSNELTSTSTTSYAYDYNGNTTSKTDSTGTTNYTWDFENRLTQITLPGTGGTATFKYNPFGQRIQKVFTQNSTTTTTNYLYDGDNAIETVDQNGNVVAKYAQGQSIDEPLAESLSGVTSFYEQDGLGSVTSLTSAAGAVAQTYTYDSFGKLSSSSGSITNPFRYTGRDFDSETGLYYYRARYYDADAGRFVSEDLVRFDSGPDFYEFVLNNPIDYRDPTGFKTSVCCRPLRYIIGKIGLNHCYVKITDDQGTHTYGLHREDANNVLYPGGARSVKDDPTDTGGTCKDVKNATPCSEGALEKGFDNPNCPSCGQNYRWSSTNSNFFVPWLLEQFGMTPPNFGGAIRAPGYYGPIFPEPPFLPFPF